MSLSKRIAFVSNTSWSLFNFRIEVLKALREDGYEIYLIAPKDEFTSKLISEGFEYEQIYINKYGTKIWQEVKLIEQLYKIYKRIQPHLIFHYTAKPNIYGSWAAKSLHIPNILITTGLGHLFNFKNKKYFPLVKALYKRASKASNEVWFLNQDDRNTFVNKNILKEEKSFILPSEGINTQYFSKEYFSKQGEQVTEFLYAGRLLKSKGIEQYIEAARAIRKKKPTIHFNVLGFIDEENPDSIKYADLIREHNSGSIKYLGETSDIRPYLNHTDCLVFPSYYKEGISRILMEASALQVPIITTDNTGCKDVVTHLKSGLLIKPKSTEELINALEYFISLSQGEREELGLRGRELVMEKFDMKKIISIYQDTCNRYI